MPNQRACLPCKNKKVYDFLNERLGRGASLFTISAELAQPFRMRDFGYGKAPGPTMLENHMRNHGRRVTPVDTSEARMPVFSGPQEVPAVVFDPAKDIASQIQQQALEQLARGDMRISAAHALKAQELLDKRAEKAADRELQVALARIVLARKVPPAHLVGGEDAIIEGRAEEVHKADPASS